jgi:dimethylamine/trimethylamine dehydrogenase
MQSAEQIGKVSSVSRLFEAVPIGPKVAKNRFYLSPHGLGAAIDIFDRSVRIRSEASRGGWAVVSTEQTEISASTDMSPAKEFYLFEAQHLRLADRICRAIHKEGALAAIELSHSGCNVSNWASCKPPIAASGGLVDDLSVAASPVNAVTAGKAELAQIRAEQRLAAERAAAIGFDIVYVYASSVLSIPGQFLSPRFNRRTDAYGGSITNRVRFLRELIEVTQEAVAGRSAVAVRMTLDDLLSPTDDFADLREAFNQLGELPDLWDITIGGIGEDAGSARFNSSERQIKTLQRVKFLTSKPIAAVGFVGTPDEMASVIDDGVVDFIAAARASIADPHFPSKVKRLRYDEIVHCIKCNHCVACDLMGVPVRCTQNPTFGEPRQTRRLPTKTAPAAKRTVAIVGAGPAGLEAACACVNRGFNVEIFERGDRIGGRILFESAMPGLSIWDRVISGRMQILDRSSRSKVNLRTQVDADILSAHNFAGVIFATGSQWNSTNFERCGEMPVQIDKSAPIFTPDDVRAGAKLEEHIVLYDIEGYYQAGLLAEYFVSFGHLVTYVTPWTEVSPFTKFTMEQVFVQRRLMKLGVDIRTAHSVARMSKRSIELECIYSGRQQEMSIGSIVVVGSRSPNRSLYDRMVAEHETSAPRLKLAGDAAHPATIAHAIYSAHQAATDLLETLQ